MIRRPPRSTRFPSTTLFRSRQRREPAHHGQDGQPPAQPGELPQVPGAGRVVDDADGEEERGLEQDRKSTRLNSSHANITYAVFCLKNKTTQIKYAVMLARVR